MARIEGFSAQLINGSTYLLKEGTTAYVRIASGIPLPYNENIAYCTLIITTSEGKGEVAADGATLRISAASVNTPAPTGNPYANDQYALFATYSGQPLESWQWDVQLRGKAGAYGSEAFFFRFIAHKPGGGTYAEYQGSISFNLVNASGQGQAPAVPVNISGETVSSTSQRINWDAPIAAEKTIVYRSLTAVGGYSVVQTVFGGGNGKTYLSTGLTADTMYYYVLQCQNSFGSSAQVFMASGLRTFKTPVVPDAPEVVSITSPTHTNIVVTYTPSEESPTGAGTTFENTYNIYYRLTSDPDVIGSYTKVEVDKSLTTVKINALTPSTSYTLYMTAENEGGESSGTAKTAITTQDDPAVPTAPTGFTVVTVDYLSQALSWTQTNKANILGTFVYISTNGGSTYTPYQTEALDPNVTSLTVTGLDAATEYYWQLFTYNNFGGTSNYSTTVTANAATGTPPAQPDPATLVSVTSSNNNSAQLTWTPGANDTQIGFKIQRAVVTGGPYTTVKEISSPENNKPSSYTFTDTGLSANARYYYVVVAVGWAGDVAASNEISVTTQINLGEVEYESGFTLHPDSRNRIIETAGKAIITSDRDRWLVRENGNWYKAGLRPIRGTTALAKAADGVLEDGTYRVYLVLVRGTTRSVPSAPSATVTIDDTDRTLVVTPPLNSDDSEIECRDLGFDLFGNTITAADSWEIYLAEENQGKAYRVAKLPMTTTAWEDTAGSKTYTIDNTLGIQDLFGGTRRPLEIFGESSLPPSCWEAEIKDNRIVATGELDIEPTDEEVDDGATLVVAGGDKYFTVTDWDATDACVYHRLIINGVDTGWEVYDYDYDAVLTTTVTKCYIRHSDPSVNESGFEGAGGSFTVFALAGNPNRVYFSAFFSGEALAGLTYSPETFPPLTIFETEFFPDDNTSPNGIIAVGGSLLVGKEDKWVAASGGDEPDFPIVQTQAISRGSGLNAPFSMARDANDVCYYLGDTGPFRVTPGGVDKVTIRFGNARLFTEVFDISSVPNAKGAWFSREDWYVVVGLNRIGSSGNRDGFVLDIKNGAILPFTMPYEVTHIKEYKSTGGEFQLLMGTTQGRIGYMLKKDLYIDSVDYTDSYPYLNASAVEFSLTTGIVDTDNSITPRSIQPRIKTMPGGAVFTYLFAVDGKNRSSSPQVFNAEDYVTFKSQTQSDHESLSGGRYDQLQFRLTGQTLVQSPNAYFEIKELPVEVVMRNAS